MKSATTIEEPRRTLALTAAMVSRSVQIRVVAGGRDYPRCTGINVTTPEVASMHDVDAAPSEDWVSLPLGEDVC